MQTPSIWVGPVAGRAIAVVRAQVAPPDLGRAVQSGCGAVWNELRAQGLRGGRNIAVYHDDLITVDAGVEFDRAFEARHGVVSASTPSGLVATLRHVGPYGRLHEAHDAIRAWAREQGYRLVGPRWETYGHWQAEWNTDPSRIETDVSYLVTHA